jgi:hypothetical protein
MPSGVTRILDASHLNAGGARTLYDLGCGNGKLALQALLQYPNLNLVVGVELSQSRFERGCAALSKWAASAASYGSEKISWHQIDPGVNELRLTADKTKAPRVLQLRREDLFTTPGLVHADILICEIGNPPRLFFTLVTA